MFLLPSSMRELFSRDYTYGMLGAKPDDPDEKTPHKKKSRAVLLVLCWLLAGATGWEALRWLSAGLFQRTQGLQRERS